MRVYDTPTNDAINSGIFATRGMILFDFPSGLYGFWDGTEPLTWNSITFQAGAQLIEIEWPEESISMDSAPLTVKLYENPDAGITSSILRTIEAEAYHQRPVTIYKAKINVDTRALLWVERKWGGYVDQILHDYGSGRFGIVGKLESRSIDYTKSGTAMAANAPQQEISPGDVGLEFAGVVGSVQVPFGAETPKGSGIEYVRRPVL